VIALVTFVVWTVAEEDTLFVTEREFMRVIGSKIREACTPKDFKEGVGFVWVCDFKKCDLKK
jgi:hypothetical protein